MATIPDSIMATIVAGWTGAGGVIPTGQYVSEDYTTTGRAATGAEFIWIDSLFDTDPTAVNDDFENRVHTVKIMANTQTNADRRKAVADEIVRILNSTAITGVTYQRVSGRKVIKPEKVRGQQAEMITVTLIEQMASGASAYGAGATGDFTVTGDIISSSVYSHEEEGMLGSANAAWVGCPFIGGSNYNDWYFGHTSNGSNAEWGYKILQPLTKGGLKLYLSGFRTVVSDADGTNYINRITPTDLSFGGVALLSTYIDNTNITAPAVTTKTFTGFDLSVYDGVGFWVDIISDSANALDVIGFEAKVYYA